ncbi:MAG: hypothetical protein ABIW33_08265 [Sphingomicrobium sp.]
MIYKRVAARLKAQDWLAITIEIGIVVIGVFVGTLVANWNQDRVGKREVTKLLDQMRPQLAQTQLIDASEQVYYATTRRYADTALAGWARDPQVSDPRVSDQDFVIAAYQASQITGNATDGQNIALVLGGDQIRQIDDPVLRKAVMRMIMFDYQTISVGSMQTRYREDVRQIIPDVIQQRIRAGCGDRRQANGFLFLPPACSVELDPGLVSATAAALRARPELQRELQFHLAQVATFLLNVDGLEQRVDQLSALLDKR